MLMVLFYGFLFAVLFGVGLGMFALFVLRPIIWMARKVLSVLR